MASTYTVELYKDKKRQYRWRVKHKNGEVIANSGEGVFNREDCLTSLANFVSDIQQSKLKDLTGLITPRKR